ncbi:hypothetical protein J5N97_029812 [Dioscorea zingiberensis]|uniref:Glycosyltransferase n=1 Tax=Dioscorea zingiberensis TaxID=325984 RepID=A0A9D5H3L9_9LILI|nr:hypothetical protein J5N97_029812 [Dioscorea zingiberensis]
MASAKSPPHVAFLAFPFGGHASCLFTLARALAAAVPFAAFSFFNTGRSNSGLLRSTPSGPPPNLRIYDVPDGLSEEGPWLPPPEEVRLFLEMTPGNFIEAMAAAEGEFGKVSCFIGDCFLWFAGDVAAERSASWVAVRTGGTTSLAAHIYTDLLRQKVGVDDQGRGNDLVDFIPGLESMRVRDLPDGIVFGDTKSVFPTLLHRMGQELPRANCVVLNTFEGLNPSLDSEFQSKFMKCLHVGPLSLLLPQTPSSDKHGCLEWLDTQKEASIVYICFGSVINPPPRELAEIAAGLEASGVQFIWSLKDVARVHLPPGFLDRVAGRGLVVPWAPQKEVLAHFAIGAFLTHCGWSSILESIVGGVPLLCRPFFGDQPMNARAVSHVWKIGIVFEGGVVKKEEMVNALNVILKADAGKKMRVNVNQLKIMALQATMPGGSTVKNFDALGRMIQGCQGS